MSISSTTTTTTTTTTTRPVRRNPTFVVGNTATIPSTHHSSSISAAHLPDTINTRKRKRTPFECIICLNAFKINIPHGTEKCEHQICRDCVRKYFNSALKNTRYTSYEYVPCPSPGCSEYFVTDETLQNFFSKAEVKKWWNSAIIKAYIINKVSCPMSGCHAVFDVDESLFKKCTFTECYECRRGFCIACQKPWHPGEVRIVDDEEELKKTLKKAELNNWCRCPKCSRIVEKVSGCSTIRCYCGTYFCYRCGGISDDHYCRNRCQDLNQERLSALRSPMFAHQKKPRAI